MKVTLNRLNQAVHFEGESASTDVKVHIDGSPEIGGEALGARPMELVLMALGSCSALDLINILKKQKQEIEDVKIEVDGKRKDAIPAVFTDIHLLFKLKGRIDIEKAKKAAELAVKKYCSVHDMLVAGGVQITYEIVTEAV
ncbi:MULTISPECIES: OsmC family protein [Olivibacter]|jgi:putative redox protein|uniref:OsmC family protein n=1 Tax=Olivibacter oleidegradans TaxID=760123 RepID=A0ABV6HR06_9SPHI|nr:MULTISPECIES: OsmC family protein [Olivibacter]MDM8174370.1 OsmC family protein [Olivibacter sp. 47]QEL04185.1 OsmC family protein [Olivibacter sp. LS-1]